MKNKSIAVVGSGISGLSAAWLLSKKHQVTLYDKNDYPGGHSNTRTVVVNGKPVAVDTGFIVFNERTYPNLIALFEHLNVSSAPTNMSFAVSAGNGTYEYSGSGLAGFFGQKRNVLRPRHYKMLADIRRFFKEPMNLLSGDHQDMSLGEFLKQGRYSSAFVQDHILPMGAAIWSTPSEKIADFPLRSFLQFFDNHGLLQFTDRPKWRTVLGGSQNYVGAMLADSNIDLKTNSPIDRIERHGEGVSVHVAGGHAFHHDEVILACHSDEALSLLSDADFQEENILSGIRYSPNEAVLHSDKSVMPRRKHLWSAWNFIRPQIGKDGLPIVSYWMNELQPLECDTDLFVTLNASEKICEKDVLYRTSYMHPVFDRTALRAQKALWSLQGRRNTWFCGAYFGSGF
ncbi:MAG: FAD-dependent oxidoreductase, partial [Stappiaceae bacterium]